MADVTEIFADLDQYELTPEQAAKVARLRAMAQSKGLLLVDPTATANPKQAALRQAPVPTKTFAESATEFITKDVPEIGAATAGGMAGAQQAARLPLPGMLKPIGIGVGSIAGATSALTGLRTARQGIESGQFPSFDQILAEGKRSGIEATVGEGLGAGPRLLGKGYQLGKQHLLAGRVAFPEEMATFQKAQDVGVHLTPADITMQPSAFRTEQTLRGTQAGADIFKKRSLLNQANFERAYEHDLLNTVASKVTSQERGQLLKDVLEGRAIPEYQEMARRGFDELRQITQGEKVVVPKEAFAMAQELAGSITADTNPKAAGIIKKVLEQLGQPGKQTGLSVKSSSGAGGELQGLKVTTRSEASQYPRPLDFMEAHDVRSMLGELGSTGETLPKKASGIASKLWQILGLEMEQGAITFQQKTGIPLARKWRQSDDLVKTEGHQLFDDNVISRMLKSRPEDVVQETLKPHGLTEVQRVTQALGRIKDEPGLEQYRRGVLEHLWNKSVLESGTRRGEFSGTAFADTAAKLGDDVLQEALGPLVYGRFKKFLDVAAHMDPKQAAGQGMSLIDKGVLITAPLAGVGGAVMSGSPYPLVAAAGTMGTWLISTSHFSKMLNDPKQAEKLLRTMRISPGTEAWTRALGQLVSLETSKRAFPRTPTPGIEPPGASVQPMTNE